MSDLMKDGHDVGNSSNGNNSENGSSHGEGLGGGGNNSDNSALVSLGNTSFGFNFDSEDGSGPNNSLRNSSGNSEEGDTNSSSGGSSHGNTSDQGDDSGNSGGKPKSQSPTDCAKAVKDGAAKPKGSHHSKNDVPSVTDENSSSAGTRRIPPLSAGAAAAAKVSDSATQRDTSSSSLSLTTTTASSTNNTSPQADGCVQSDATAAKVSDSSSAVTRDSSSTTLTGSRTQTLSEGITQSDAAAAASANLKSIAAASIKAVENAAAAAGKQSLKRKSPDPATDNDSGGYNSDEDNEYMSGSASRGMMEDGESGGAGRGNSKSGGSKKKKRLDEMKREERNAREKERSFRISAQISELRDLLSSGGVIVPKGTKSSVLTEAANYIRMLQQHQYRSEIDRHQLVQQIQMIGGGALGQQAATAVRHVAAQNGVWSLGNFGGVPPKSAAMYHKSGEDATKSNESAGSECTSPDGSVLPYKIVEGDYRHVFNACGVGMAIASMGGAFIDCNKLFSQLSNYSKQEVCSMTVFNLTARQDLQAAFDLISQMLSTPTENDSASSTSCALRGSFKHRGDLGLSVTLIKGEDGVAKCFCVTLIMNPTSPYDNARPVPATIDLINTSSTALSGTSMKSEQQMEPTSQPAYTTG